MSTFKRPFRFSAAVLTLAVLLVGTTAAADDKKGKEAPKEEEADKKNEPVWPSPLDPGVFDPVFKELPFGKERSLFLAELEARFNRQLEPVLRATLDPRERDNLNEKVGKTFNEVKGSHVELDGTKPGYGVSIIAGEYRDHAGESLHKYAYSDNSTYFFFSGDRFWKQFICSQGEADFASLLVKLATLYGDPADIQYLDEEKTEPIKASWRDTTFELAAAAPEGIFVCSRMVWTFLPFLPTVEEARKAAENKDDSGTSADNFLQQITSDPSNADPNVMDKILDRKKDK